MTGWKLNGRKPISIVHCITRTTDILSVAPDFPTDKMSIVHCITRTTDILSVASQLSDGQDVYRTLHHRYDGHPVRRFTTFRRTGWKPISLLKPIPL